MALELYNANTPNGKKIYILAEELGIEYKHHAIKFANQDQFKPEFLKISPNNKIPAIVDNNPPAAAGEGPLSIFESVAILQYLAEHKAPPGAPDLYPKNPRVRAKVNEWCYFQIASLGPMMGQLGFFTLNAEKSDLAVNRFRNEVERIFGVMERQLAQNDYFAGKDYTIADIAIYPWTSAYGFAGLDIAKYPSVKAWIDRVGERPKVQKAIEKGNELNS